MIIKQFKNIIFIFFSVCFYTTNVVGQNPDTIIWPGDINNNGIVNHLDIIYLGANFGATGAERNFISTEWEGYSLPTGWSNGNMGTTEISRAFADCNGDGVVSDLDYAAIENNYGLSHDTIFPDEFIEVLNDEPELNFAGGVSSIALEPSSVQEFDINLGSFSAPAENFYGIAFTISVNADYVNINNINFDVSTEWIDPNQAGIITFQKLDIVNNKLHIAISRKDQASVIGSSAIGKLNLIIEDDVPSFTSNVEILTFENIYLVDPILNTYKVNDMPLVVDITSPITEITQEEIKIYPNPIQKGSVLKVEGIENFDIQTITLMNISGQKVEATISNNEISTEKLSKGIYFLEIITDQGRRLEKLIITD